MLMNAQSRGIDALPGGVSLYKADADGVQTLVGGIGMFFPEDDGHASSEQSFVAGQTTTERLNANDLVTRADEVFVRGLWLSHQEFLRNPHA
jgi:hypothetical protein